MYRPLFYCYSSADSLRMGLLTPVLSAPRGIIKFTPHKRKFYRSLIFWTEGCHTRYRNHFFIAGVVALFSFNLATSDRREPIPFLLASQHYPPCILYHQKDLCRNLLRRVHLVEILSQVLCRNVASTSAYGQCPEPHGKPRLGPRQTSYTLLVHGYWNYMIGFRQAYEKLGLITRIW